ncbi:MAG: hypothetical protein KF732_09405 [Flavobacteriales bacterium]|nr:hypothetical protein [Flavobacteriales bacterium]MBX2960159.1 hypothetical protein [Flavobacteriales bacterium]MCL4855979.1 hypothetical protein [Flavobacteriales bacterium]
MKNIFSILIVLFIAQTGFGQTNSTQFADKSPLFNGATEETNGIKIKTHFKGCGLKLLENDKNRYIGVSFIIDSIGTPTSPIVLFGNDSIMFNKIVNCVENTPKWIPAKKNGRDVSCWYNLAFEK